MTARVTCRACHQPIAWWDHRLLVLDRGQSILNYAIDSHQCAGGPLRCGRCGYVIAATGDLPEQLARAAAANHRHYCGRAA